MKSTPGNWSVAEAKQRLSELLRAAARSPQLILNRGQPVAAVIDSGEFAEFLEWQTTHAARSVAEVFGELRRIGADESYRLEVPPRIDRSSGWPDDVNAVPRRHKRR